jgi:hypothetical protein
MCSMIQLPQDIEIVQMGVLKNLSSFLGLLSEPCRVSYFPLLHDILHTSNPFTWRLRQSLAVQLPALIDLPPKHEVYTTLFPLVMTLLQDPVASVRRDSFKGVAKLLLILKDQTKDGSVLNATGEDATHENLQDLEAVVATINMLIRGETYQLRQLWLELSVRLLRELPQEMFEKYFVDGILKLTLDPVPNVRVTVGLLLAGWAPEDLAPWENPTGNDGEGEQESSLLTGSGERTQLPRNRVSPWKWLMERTDIQECVRRLSEDDNDVYLSMVKLQPLFPDIQFKSISCRGMKGPPGGSTPISLSGVEPLPVAVPPAVLASIPHISIDRRDAVDPVTVPSPEELMSISDLSPAALSVLEAEPEQDLDLDVGVDSDINSATGHIQAMEDVEILESLESEPVSVSSIAVTVDNNDSIKELEDLLESLEMEANTIMGSSGSDAEPSMPAEPSISESTPSVTVDGSHSSNDIGTEHSESAPEDQSTQVI